jgi:formyl-CoA transferase
MIAETIHPKIGPLRMPNVPLRMSDTPAAVRTAPPLLGEHTDALLHDLLNYDAGKLQALRTSGAI